MKRRGEEKKQVCQCCLHGEYSRNNYNAISGAENMSGFVESVATRGEREAFSCPAARNAICIHKRISRRAYKACKNTRPLSSDLIFVRLLISRLWIPPVPPGSRVIWRRFIIVIHSVSRLSRVEPPPKHRPRCNFRERIVLGIAIVIPLGLLD